MARDNFNKPTIEKLKARVAHRCSNPKCRVPTSAASSHDSVNNIGIAAHICAASSGGPRYKRSMTTDERKSIDNAIWLCSNCSTDIDRDETRYTVKLLNDWKEKAEGSARSELGNKLPSNNETIDTVAAALTGLPKNYISNAISNVHKASGIALESLDPRFLVKTAHDDGKTLIGIYAKEEVSLSMKVNGAGAKEYMEKHNQLMEHGKDVRISSDVITFEGSKLIEEMFGRNEGVLSISAKKISATQKLWLVQKGTSLIESFDDIQGEISFGTKSFTFNGAACNKLFSFSYQKSLDENNEKGDITMSLCLELWEGINLKFLPYLEKITSFFSKIAQGWEVFTTLEINGLRIFSSTSFKVNDLDYVQDMACFLDYINRCKIISEAFKYEVNYTSDVSCTSEDHKYLADIVSVIEGKQTINNGDTTENTFCELIVDDECNNVKKLIAITEPSSIRIVQKAGEKVELFGVEINLPPKIICLYYVLPKIYGKVDKLKSGDIVKIEWLPQQGYRGILSYES